MQDPNNARLTDLTSYGNLGKSSTEQGADGPRKDTAAVELVGLELALEGLAAAHGKGASSVPGVVLPVSDVARRVQGPGAEARVGSVLEAAWAAHG